MAGYRNFEYDFIERTLQIIENYSDGFDITLQINCCVGLLVIPKEKLFEELPLSTLNNDSKLFGIRRRNIRFIKPERQSLRFENYDAYNIRNIVTHMRNAVAHGNIAQNSIREGNIESLRFIDKFRAEKTFETIVTVDEFKEFCIAIAKEVLKSKPGS